MPATFLDGRFEDIGGSDSIPDFGGFYHDSAKDKAGPNLALRDLDGDGDLDLVQSCHIDLREPLLPYSPGEYRQGVFCWQNLFRETGETRFAKVTGNGLAVEARLRYNREEQLYENASDAKAPGLPYLFFGDVDNDGLQDALAIGPSDSSWSPRTEDVGGRFWRNLGGFRFEERTEAAGLAALNWNYRQWHEFFEQPMSAAHRNWRPRGGTRSQPGVPSRHPLENRPYYADAVFGDFDNDGWLDLVVLDRRESSNLPTRSMLWMNRGDGTFEAKSTTFSGLDGSGISAEAADLNGDGLLDLFFAADPDNTGVALDIARYESKVYWNTGEHGARESVFYFTHRDSPNFPEEFTQFLATLIAYLFSQFVMSPTVNAIKDPVYQLCIDLTKGNTLTTSAALTKDFRARLSEACEGKMARAFILLHAYLNPHQDTLLPSNSEIEHIFPRKWQSTNYFGWTQEAAAAFLERFGNKVAIEKKLNVQAGNGYFGKKKEKYRSSAVAEVRDLAQYPKDDSYERHPFACEREVGRAR